MRGISASQARLELLNVTAIPWFIEEWSQPLLNTLEKLIREMNCQQFHFTRSVDAVRALERAQAEGAEVCA